MPLGVLLVDSTLGFVLPSILSVMTNDTSHICNVDGKTEFRMYVKNRIRI